MIIIPLGDSIVGHPLLSVVVTELQANEVPQWQDELQHNLDRVWPPRVHITYDVEIGNAIKLKELPFVMGVLGDLSGQPERPPDAVKDRKFVEINLDNFEAVFKGMEPPLAFSVANKLSDIVGDAQPRIDLTIQSLGNFESENVARKIEPLRELLELRRRLSDLRGSLQGNDTLDQMLVDAMSNTEMRDKLRKELNAREGAE